ncbi:MAG: hypothetical protein CMO81_06925 [Waddliaceae bacterium]|nr:hypothetical protein [Waddliaceae bacterium]
MHFQVTIENISIWGYDKRTPEETYGEKTYGNIYISYNSGEKQLITPEQHNLLIAQINSNNIPLNCALGSVQTRPFQAISEQNSFWESKSTLLQSGEISEEILQIVFRNNPQV